MVVAADLLPYPITVAAGALDRLPVALREVAPRNRVAVITDLAVATLYGERVALLLRDLDARVASFPITEETKTRETWTTITDTLLSDRYGRDTTLVALGGGVVGDVVGFVAATYLRGVPYIQVPTTLLAMVDASVGGKTGVDTPHGKNLVGAFHQPKAVLIDPSLLETLPPAHVRAGFAEIIKHGVVADSMYFASTRSFLEGGMQPPRWAALASLIERSVQIKASIVAQDERESGRRKVLNFGHTIAHAIEAATNYGTPHGDAVAIGMIVEAQIAERLDLAELGMAAEITDVCRAAGLPTSPPSVDVETLLAFTRSDKKSRAGRAEYALPRRIGEMAGEERGWSIPVDDAVVREVLRG